MKELLTPHPEEQRSLAELREEYRAKHRAELRWQMTHHLGWGVIGAPEKSRVHYSAEEWAREMLTRLDAPVNWELSGEVKEAGKLEELAQKALLHEQVTWAEGTEGTVDHDAPPCKPVHLMTDEEIVRYVDHAIERSDDRQTRA